MTVLWDDFAHGAFAPADGASIGGIAPFPVRDLLNRLRSDSASALADTVSDEQQSDALSLLRGICALSQLDKKPGFGADISQRFRRPCVCI